MRWSRAWWSTCLLALLTGRADSTPRLGPDPEAVYRAPTPDDLQVSGESNLTGPASQDAAAACRARVAAVRAEAALPGAPELEESKDIVLLYAKGEPVHFTRKPVLDQHVTQAARTYRSMLRRGNSPWGLLKQLSSVFAANVELGRAVLLSEGYLYAEQPRLAFALVDLVAAQMLFNEKQIWIQRGDRMLHAERTNTGQYAFIDGAERGQRVRLMLFDRIGVGTPPLALHRDFRELRQRLGFDRARVLHQTPGALVVHLRYGSRWVESLLEAEDAHLKLDCELLGDRAEEVRAYREAQVERAKLLDPLRKAMLAQVEEGLPFDEPRLEYGQQDGQMRNFWLNAYKSKRTSFEFNDDIYYVFDGQGRPKVPQVCIDFIFDTFERASGRWWLPRSQAPGVTPGKLDLARLTPLDLRRATSIVELAKAQPELLELLTLPENERVPFKYGPRLADYLTEHADQYLPGDIVLIKGYAPWDKPWMPKVMHQHSFFVYETDPLSGMPIVLAGNPGEPVLQTWQFEAFRTPERSIQYRIRPHVAWLRQFLNAPAEVPPPALLTVDPRAPSRGPPLAARMPRDIPTPPGVELER
ncbi:MAG TPA: hypothetical protein VJN18_33895 [Polyangiaceae bacterium]|nr:hypothetical protein [Polyangiaceae bacterium]